MRGDTSFGCSIYQDIETKHIFIIPLSRSLPSGTGGYQSKIYHIQDKENAKNIGDKILNAIQDAIKLPNIQDNEGMQNNFEEFGIGQYIKNNVDIRDKKCYDVSFHYLKNFANRFQAFSIPDKKRYQNFPDLVKDDEIYNITPLRHEKNRNRGYTEDPVFLLPYSTTPEKIGEAVIDAFKWIDDNFADKKK